MKSYYVYILQCSDDSYYTGVTSQVEERFNLHMTGSDTRCYTYTRRPVTLVYTEEFQNVFEAIQREKQIKGWTRRKKEALINRDLKTLKHLSRSHGSAGSP